MTIELDMLYKSGAIVKNYQKDEVVFYEDEPAGYYFHIIEGCIKIYNLNDEGKELTQGYFKTGQSFGETPLLIDENYPLTAVATKESKVVLLPKDKFLEILENHSEIKTHFLKLMAFRIHSKTITSREYINQNSKHRIIAFFELHKKNKNLLEKELIPFTRQEIANFTGLRVETVIRTLLKMSKKGEVEIIDHKIYF